MSNVVSPELIKTVVLLATSVTIVPLFKRIGLGSVLGYLVAGCLIGPSVFSFIKDAESVLHMAELGVVMFLFIIGLEMHPERLWAMRKAIFGRGLLQVGLCGSLLTLAGIYLLKLPKEVAFIAGMGFTLSSTAIVMQVLEERGITNTSKGQRVISTLIFEDLAIVPLLASIAFLTPETTHIEHHTNWTSIAIALGAVVGLVVAGKWLMNPIFRLISKAHIREMMTAAALLVVLGAALAMEASGLSMAMGAFVAGVMLSESAFRHQLEADIEPFRGLLLGLFFMGVGMSLDLSLVFNDAVWLLGIVCLYIVGKALAVYTVARITKLDRTESVGRMTIMAHGGEFAFVLFSAATTAGVMTKDQNATFTAAVIISMLFSPLIGLLMRKINQRKSANQEEKVDISDLDPIVDLEDSVLVIGFGRFSQIVCQSLLVRGINVSVIDRNIENIRAAAKFGFKVYYGDGIRLDVLRAAGIEKAKCVVIGINDTQRIESIVQNLKDAYPKLPILARTYDRQTTVSLIKQDVDFIVRETFESALTLSRATLMQLGINKIEADEVIAEVRYLDQERLNEEVLHGFSTDIIRKYWMPKPFIKPHSDAEALNEETAEILEKEDDTNDEATVETLLHDDSETEKQKEVK
ncbi:MAG: monovalent cation:proton antiporter-2 (CPA2) family protein [Haemophilus parainfluenzae]|nr:monovalent cation:proton antiporter-2 (CPA2) family protein [Haemophilus parainfluenzae]